MNRLGKIAISLAGVLALNTGLRAAGLTATNNPLPGNPYAPIVSRNIFGLLPPEAPPDPALEAAKSLPKITPTGIMGVFGNWQVLFKVAAAATAKPGQPGQPGQPAKDDFYILSQGQRQDDIEVLKIDEKKGIVTFDNHGTTQELPLAAASGTGGGPAGPSSPGGMKPGMAPGGPGGGPSGGPGGGPGGPGGFTRFGAGGGNNGGNPNANPGSNGGPGNPNGSLNNGNSMQSRNYQPTQDNPPASLETQIIQMEANRALAQQKNDPQASLIPPTPITEFNTPEAP
jgi:hypothetical protein